MKVIYTNETKIYLWELVEMLYFKDYFGFKSSARKYVFELISNMEATIHIKQRYESSPHFAKYGKNLYYVFYPKNKRTTWYFFFTYHPESDTYFIRYITNNHVEGHLIK